MEHNIKFDIGELLYFKPFWFPDGGTPKSKYFVVLHNDGNGVLLASLPTSKDHIPSDVVFHAGCIELPERNINAFVFPSQTKITECFSFPMNTYIYGSNIHEYKKSAILLPICIKKATVETKGTLLPELFEKLLTCLKTSSSVKRKYKKIL